MKEEPWRNLGGESIEEPTGRCLGGVWEISEVSGSIWEASGSHLGGISEAAGRLRWPRGVFEVKVVQTMVFYSKNARDRPFRLDETRASVTKCCQNQYIRVDV